MPRVRHRSRDELPPAPLDFADPLSVPDETVLGAVLLHEVPAPFALHAFQALRAVFAWAAGPRASADLFDADGMAAWEEDVLRTEGVDEALWAPVSVIVGELVRPAEAEPEVLANACLAAADWAFGARAEGTALLFAEAAAAAWPTNARIAWLAGRFHRERLQITRAEMWFRRASRVAVWTGDWELQARALNSLGNLKVHVGDLAAGRELLESTVRLAKRKRLRERLAMAHHDLFVAATLARDFRSAEAHARKAFDAYGPTHPRVVNLAYDVALFWLEDGRFAPAFEVFTALRDRFAEDEHRLRILASTARAAGQLGELDALSQAWRTAWDLIEKDAAPGLRASAALALGLGALNAGRLDDARYALETARDSATALREGDTLALAEAALVELEQQVDLGPLPPGRSSHRRITGAFSSVLAETLTSSNLVAVAEE